MTSYQSMRKALAPIKAYNLDDSEQLQKELTVFAEVFDEVTAEIDSIIAESIISTASDRGLLFYERLLGTSAALSNPTPQLRRENVINALMLDEGSHTMSGIQRFFTSIGFECEIREVPNIFELYISPTSSGYTNQEKQYIRKRAAEFLPCHLSFLIDFRSVTWADYDNRQLSFRDLDFMQQSWEEIENTDF